MKINIIINKIISKNNCKNIIKLFGKILNLKRKIFLIVYFIFPAVI